MNDLKAIFCSSIPPSPQTYIYAYKLYVQIVGVVELLQVSSLSLLTLNSLKQALEVACPEAFK